MNKATTIRLKAVIITLLITSSVSFSQFKLKEINGDFFRGGINDGVKLFEAFITPSANAFGAGFNGGWYNTAKPHKFGGFDITVTTNFGFVPSSALTFDLKTLGFQTLTLTNPTGTSLSPTIAGSKTPGPELHAMAGTVELAKFKAPAGVNLKFMPVPIVQVGIGLPLGTEVKIRYFPKIGKDYQLSIWGVGLIHSIMQYVPGNDLLPFDISVFGGYSKLKLAVPISVQPESGTSFDIKYVNYSNPTSFLDQSISTSVSAWNISLIGSVKLAVITFYGGLGYSKTNTNISFTGNYPTPRAPVPPGETKVVYDDAGVKKINPVDIENYSGLRANIGMRLKLAVITIHADYTKSQYNVLSLGLGVSFR